MWTRARPGDFNYEDEDEVRPASTPAPGRRTRTQSLRYLQRRVADAAPPAPGSHGDALASSRYAISGDQTVTSAEIADPFDFRFLAQTGTPRFVQRKAVEGSACACGTCESCRAGASATDSAADLARSVQRRAAGGGNLLDADAAVSQGLGSAGHALDSDVRSFMEARFGHDFGDVRVHVDGVAGESARALHAEAYTVGRDIVFAPGKYEPGSAAGQRLIAHELTHVVQQGGGRAAPVAQRRAAPHAPAAAPGGRAAAGDSTARLQQLIAKIETVRVRALRATGEASDEAGEGGPSSDAADVGQHLDRVGQLLAQLRAVAAGSDEAAKQRVLKAFSPASAQQAETILESQVRIEQRRPEGMAARSVEVSEPSDTAELEAERVADAVMGGGSATVQERASGAHRQVAEALSAEELLIGGGVAVLEADAAVAPETGPPGWVIGGIVALGALAAIGIGYVLMASHGNVADTGIMEEAQALIAAGAAATICAALEILWNQERDAARKQRIKATQKAKGCRHSRHS